MNLGIKNGKSFIRRLFWLGSILLVLFVIYFNIQISTWERVDNETGQILNCVLKINENDKPSSDCVVRLHDGTTTAVHGIKDYTHNNKLNTLKVEVNKFRKNQKRYSKLDEN